MTEVRPPYDDEIDLSELVKTLWLGKWTIALCTCLCLVSAIAYHKFTKNSFTATLEIKPISEVEAIKYIEFNALGFNSISVGMLLASFNTKLQDRQIWFSAFDEMYSSKKDTFENLETYNDWISSLTYSVKFELPMLDENLTEIRKQDKREYFAIKYEGFEIDEFEDVIRKVSSVANNFVKSNLIVNFEKQIIVKEQGDRFTKEDLHNSISNLMVDYDKKISVRLDFLEEQSKIARKIGVAKSTFESQTYQNTSASVTNVQTDAPFYMRGFEAIEEEIFLLKSRKNKENHIAETY
jgi:LPS O-antigen subunit length determinant protein (WzzB/FepE family)